MRTIFILYLMSNIHGIGAADSLTVFELERYLGKWYEIARFDHRFERGMQKTTAEYTLMPDGSIKVTNSGYRDGVYHQSEGKAKTTNTPGLLKVSFFWFFYSDYRILALDNDYQYALIGSKSKDYLWILSRNPIIDEGSLEEILTIATGLGYDTDKLIWVEQ
ncbi:MAG: lipocalin family protein [Bacteroidales bacterium]|nr:lipocalin family protein [Bacteroidales bacterium]